MAALCTANEDCSMLWFKISLRDCQGSGSCAPALVAAKTTGERPASMQRKRRVETLSPWNVTERHTSLDMEAAQASGCLYEQILKATVAHDIRSF